MSGFKWSGTWTGAEFHLQQLGNDKCPLQWIVKTPKNKHYIKGYRLTSNMTSMSLLESREHRHREQSYIKAINNNIKEGKKVGQLTLSSSSLNFCMWYRRQMLSSAPFSVNCVFCWNTKHDHKYSPLTHSPWTACFAETSNPYLCELVSSTFLKWQTRESISIWKTSYKHNQKDLESPPDSTGLLILFHIVSFWNPPNHDW